MGFLPARIADAIRVHGDNNQILDNDMDYLSDASRAKDVIDHLLREIGNRSKHAEAGQMNLEHCRALLRRYQDMEGKMQRERKQLEMLMSHYKAMNDAIVSLVVPLEHLADRLDGDPETTALAKGIRDYLNGSIS